MSISDYRVTARRSVEWATKGMGALKRRKGILCANISIHVYMLREFNGHRVISVAYSSFGHSTTQRSESWNNLIKIGSKESDMSELA